MDDLLTQLKELSAGLAPAVGTAPNSLALLLRRLAACLIQQAPGLVPLPPNPQADPELLQAAQEGEALAAELNAAGIRLRWLRQRYLAAATGPQRPSTVIGPFIDEQLGLVEFAFYESTPFILVMAHMALPGVVVNEPLMLLPAGSVPDPDDPLRWRLPAGTVWLRADRLLAGTAGFAALRIAGGSFDPGFPLAPPAPGGTALLALNAPWALAVKPEAPPAATEGSDAEALALELPTRLELRNGGAPVLAGRLALAGFGSALSFDTSAGALVAGGDAIGFPFDSAGAPWRIDGMRSSLCQARGEAQVAAALWSLPLSSAPLDQAGEAAHGGSIALLLRGGPALEVSGASGSCRAQDSVLSANATALEWRVRRSDANLALECELWPPVSSSRLACGEPRLGALRFASHRGAADIVTLEGGRLLNRWDLPVSAADRPFGFEGPGDAFSLIDERDGLYRAVASAERQVPLSLDAIEGYALENLYLHAHPARWTAFVGSGGRPASLTEGRAGLVFDLRLAQPMLPDPYASSWRVEHLDYPTAQRALHAMVLWSPGTAPEVRPSLHNPELSLPRVALDDFGHDADAATRRFNGLLDALPAPWSLLDLSSRDHQFGIALEGIADGAPALDEAHRLAWPLQGVRLLMQPQVHWEPVRVLANPDVLVNTEELVKSRHHGGPTLVGVLSPREAGTAQRQYVPALPGLVSDEVVARANGRQRAAALFGLPFGLHACAIMERRREEDTTPAPIEARLHQPALADPGSAVFEAARQVRLRATGAGLEQGETDPSRSMPGLLTQNRNLAGSVNGLPSVLSEEVLNVVDDTFSRRLPLHRADLSGYGLSTFSHWRRELPSLPAKEGTGVAQVRLEVLVGRTSYEVIQLQSRLWTPQCRVVRSVVLERRNSGRVTRYDSGWHAIEDGDCTRYARIDTGVVERFRNIRNIRIVPRPLVRVDVPPQQWEWQEVLYDADLLLWPDPTNMESRREVPIRDHTGYVQIKPVDKLAEESGTDDVGTMPTHEELDALMVALGHPVGGPLDAAIRLGGTLPMQLTRLEVARDASRAPPVHFVLAVSGTCALPRAGSWTPVRIDGATQDVSPVDPRRGLPVVRRDGEAEFVFREAALAYQERNERSTEFGFLMSTATARVLYRAPRVPPGTGTVQADAPRVADPYALAQASGPFPRPQFALRCLGDAIFEIGTGDAWKLAAAGGGDFAFEPPVPELAQGGAWALKRGFPNPHLMQIGLDTVAGAAPWSLGLPQPDELVLDVEGLPGGQGLFIIESAFRALSGGPAGLSQPSLRFGGALEELKRIVDVLGSFLNLALDVDVEVTAGNGPSPSFLVRLRLALRLPREPGERIDIGVGKFRGRFDVRGELRAALGGGTSGQLQVEMSGDVQQAIIPPLLYAGGQFRFALQVGSGPPLVELGLGTAASLGGDLIKNLIELELTVRYGYMLVPETLQPGVMLGMEARAKLLGGLLGVAFGVDALARLQRVDDKAVTIWAELRVAATVQVAWCLRESREIRTQFEQRIPLAALALAAGVPLPLVAASEIL